MTLQDLIRRFRVLASDTVATFLFEDEDVRGWLNDAQAQASVRGRLLLEDTNQAVCQIEIEPGRHTYPLHYSLYELVHLRVEGADFAPVEPKLVSREWLDRKSPRWRSNDGFLPGEVLFAIQGDTSIRLVGTPDRAGLLLIEGYRLPLVELTEDDDQPEIHRAHHEHLIQWALHRAFSIPESETFDPRRAAAAESEFTAYFGPLPDSNLRRITREDVEHATVSYLA